MVGNTLPGDESCVCSPLILARRRVGNIMRVWAAAFALLMANASLAATVQLTINQSSFVPGNRLILSGSIVPTNDSGVAADLYVAILAPNQSILTLTSNLVWVSTLEPMARGIALSTLHVNNFFSSLVPSGMASGQYTFYLIAVAAGRNPMLTGNWLGYSTVPVNFTNPASSPKVALTTKSGTCVAKQYCNIALVDFVSGGSSPYSYRLDSLAYGTPPSLMTVDLLTGNLEGTPSLAGTYSFQICARDIGGNQDCKPVTVTVSAAPDPSTQAWVFIGGDVATLTRLTLDGVVIKEPTSANLSRYMYMSPGTHTLSATCTEVYCFSYLQLDPPAGYAFSPTELRATPAEIPPGATKTFSFVLTKLGN